MSKLKKDAYDQLLDYVNDYIKHIEKINKRRLDIANKEVEFIQQEFVAFNLLRRNLEVLEEEMVNGIS